DSGVCYDFGRGDTKSRSWRGGLCHGAVIREYCIRPRAWKHPDISSDNIWVRGRRAARKGLPGIWCSAVVQVVLIGTIKDILAKGILVQVGDGVRRHVPDPNSEILTIRQFVLIVVCVHERCQAQLVLVALALSDFRPLLRPRQRG